MLKPLLNPDIVHFEYDCLPLIWSLRVENSLIIGCWLESDNSSDSVLELCGRMPYQDISNLSYTSVITMLHTKSEKFYLREILNYFGNPQYHLYGLSTNLATHIIDYYWASEILPEHVSINKDSKGISLIESLYIPKYT